MRNFSAIDLFASRSHNLRIHIHESLKLPDNDGILANLTVSNHMAVPNLRKIFASFRTKEDEADYGRQALYNLVGE